MEPILFNCFFNDFADDNTLTAFAQSVRTLISFLESKSNIAIEWFKTNKMIVNANNVQSIIIDEKKPGHTKETLEIWDKVTEASPSIKLLGVQIDNKLNFNLNIMNICRSAALTMLMFNTLLML